MRIRDWLKNVILKVADDGKGNFRILRGPLKGRRLVLGENDRKAYLLGGYEKTIAGHLGRECRAGTTALDVGANIGYFTLLLSELTGPGGAVFSFEPNPENAAKIRRMVDVNRIRNITVLQLAVSNHSGRMPFMVESTGSMGRLLAEPVGANGCIDVEVAPIDQVVRMQKIRMVSVIKMDIEGAEAEAIPGMKELLRRDRPVIFCEWHPAKTKSGYREIFSGVGYRCELLDPESAIETFHIVARPA
jgi:FkbM family methyltransferase